MNQISDSNKTSKVADNKYRKIYRAMIEKSNQLDEIYKSPDAFQRIFHSETTLQREKLQRYCETLIFRETIECGKKAEEILWRRVFYEIINIVKANKKNLKSNYNVETMYRLHLSSAYGFYNHLILKFQSEFNSLIQLDGFLDFPILSFEKTTNKEVKFEKSELLKEILTRMLHKFLICLGDLARYQIEYDPNGCTKLAYKYYQQSLILLYTNGMPLNQLGTLYCSENYGCDAAYYYLYCLSCTEPFMSARENLRLLFIKNRKRYDEIKSSKFIDKEKLIDYQPSELRTKEIKKFLVSFLRTIDLILSSSILFSANSSQTVTNLQLQELCQLCLQDFNACMFYTKRYSTSSEASSSTSNSSYLSDELVFKLMLTILMSLEQLKSKRFNSSSADNQQKTSNFYFTTVAFALVFFSHIVNHTIIRLQEELLNAKQKSKQTVAMFKSSCDENEEDDSAETTRLDETDRLSHMSKSSSSSSRDKSPKTGGAASKKSIRLLYGQRRRKHNSDSDTNESTFEDDERQQRASQKTTNLRKKNIAKFLDRDNLSETELNNFSDDSDNKKKKKKKKKRTTTQRSESDFNSDSDSTASNSSGSSSQSSDQEVQSKTIPTKENKANEKVSTYLETMSAQSPNEVTTEESQIGSITMNENDLFFSMNNQSISFKEFSTQLHSRLSILQEQTAPNSSLSFINSSAATILNNSIISEEFIDNEIYKSVLNGKKQVSIPPGFEKNSKEVEEIEELGKKIATFQIETDTEMSIFNSNSSSSSSENEAKESQIKCSAADFISREKLHSSCGSKEKNESKSVNKAAKISELENAKQLVDLLTKQALLPTIKVFCDWLLCNKKIIQSISQVSTTIWSKLSVLLNCIPLEKLIANEMICKNDYVKSLILRSFETKSWNSQPLSEDYHMRSFNALKLEHLSLKFDINKVNQLNVMEENLLRLCYLRRFGYLIASYSKSQTASGGLSFFEYEVQKSLFNAPIIINNPIEEIPTVVDLTSTISQTAPTFTQVKAELAQEATISKNEMKEQQKLQLMKNMAQLRLEAEISQLEAYKYDDSKLSPYLVIETEALCQNLKMVQDFSRSKKFILIIPLIVIDILDSIKKESRQARDSIRWLENQFKYGNRFLRAQTDNEKTSDIVDSNLKKKDVEMWRFLQLIDCCKYFQEESNFKKEEKKTDVVTLLINGEISEKSKIDPKSFYSIAKQNQIQLQNIKEFNSKLNLKQAS